MKVKKETLRWPRGQDKITSRCVHVLGFFFICCLFSLSGDRTRKNERHTIAAFTPRFTSARSSQVAKPHFFASRTLPATGYSISLRNGWHLLQTTVQALIEAFSWRKIIIHCCWRRHISSTKTYDFWRCLTKSWSEE